MCCFFIGDCTLVLCMYPHMSALDIHGNVFVLLLMDRSVDRVLTIIIRLSHYSIFNVTFLKNFFFLNI